MSKKPAAKGGKEEEGPQAPVFDPTTYVALASSEGDRFFLDRNCAKLSRLCKQVLHQYQQDGGVPSNQIEYSIGSATFQVAPELVAAQHAKMAAVMSTSSSADPALDSAVAAAALPDVPTTLSYPLITIHALNTAQLSRAITFMHYKYRYDSEAEKKPSIVFGRSGAVPRGADGIEWAAVAHVLQL